MIDELAARRAKKASEKVRAIETASGMAWQLMCQAKGCKATLGAFRHGAGDAARISVVTTKARGWVVSIGSPPVVLCPAHAAGHPGRIV